MTKLSETEEQFIDDLLDLHKYEYLGDAYSELIEAAEHAKNTMADVKEAIRKRMEWCLENMPVPHEVELDDQGLIP